MPKLAPVVLGCLVRNSTIDSQLGSGEIIAVDQVYLILISGPTEVQLIYNFDKGFR
jgi:hypothetical protein